MLFATDGDPYPIVLPTGYAKVTEYSNIPDYSIKLDFIVMWG